MMNRSAVKNFFRKGALARNSASNAVEEIFDAEFYTERYGTSEPDFSALKHFQEIGDKLLFCPSPLFDPAWYAHVNGLKGETTTAMFTHFDLHSKMSSRDPDPLFSTQHYRELTEMPSTENSVIHYLSQLKERTREAISPTPFFWRSYYLRLNPDVASSGIDAFRHYTIYGWKEGRQPNPYFSPAWYLQRYLDVAEAGVEPLKHFLMSGMYENRQPHYLIDLEYYVAGAPDVVAAGVNPYRHYMEHGDREGRSAHPLFDPAYYRRVGPDIGNAPPFAHFAETGCRTLRSPCPAFDARHYVKLYPEDAVEPMMSFMLTPASRRHVHPLLDGYFQSMTSLNVSNGANPLIDYVQFRSHFNSDDLIRAASTIPKKPKNALVEKACLSEFAEQPPKISIITPCYESDVTYLRICIDSVCAQDYSNWEMILVDDGSPSSGTWTELQLLEKKDPRIRAFRLERNCGISGATNYAVAKATGEYLAFLDHDDVLTPRALTTMVQALLDDEADAAYSDQAYLSADGKLEQPFLKPAWSPTLMNGVMYIGHLLVIRATTAVEAGLFKTEFDGCQDFEFMLRVGEVTTKIIHVPKILYHWRRAPGSIASDSSAKGEIEPKQAKAVNDHLFRTNQGVKATPDYRVAHRLRLSPTIKVRERVEVDIVLERGDGVATLLDSVAESANINVCDTVQVSSRLTPAKCILQGRAPWVLFLQPGVQFLDDDWFDFLMMHAEQADVAFVSPHLFRADSTVISAGLIASPHIGLQESYVGFVEGSDGSAGTLFCDREVSAVGATCSLVHREKITSTGGPKEYLLSLEGVCRDLSYRATISQLRNISIASEIVHVPMRTNALEDVIDREFFLDDHSRILSFGDKYYNVDLSTESSDFNAKY
ncbi:glycosyltransferase family 2 protein [Agrobacterium rosae]|uniref:glycosyltransferase family 2 protein n=1 Tax=Agrobacterium rosae TaxID=1972867 RepID=UPI0015E193A4|nr:glycosyltransferase [Agrobacterium rosae]